MARRNGQLRPAFATQGVPQVTSTRDVRQVVVWVVVWTECRVHR